jgi:hypothetical protein
MRFVDSRKGAFESRRFKIHRNPEALQSVTIVRGASRLKVSLNVGSRYAIGNSHPRFFCAGGLGKFSLFGCVR